MGKKGKRNPNQNPNTTSTGTKQEDLIKTLGDFTKKENWDEFFTLRGAGDYFEWYAEWPQLRNLITAHLPLHSIRTESGENPPAPANILVPGCGNSKLSEHLYDAGFTNITNVDFSKVVISDMLRRNVRDRPGMKWRVMDMTKMQFVNESFDAIVDKGGLDALMEPKLGSSLGSPYLSEVKRLLKVGGKFICLTLAESYVLDLLFPQFRFGWKMSLYAIAPEPSSGNPKLDTFVVIVERDHSSVISDISSFVDQSSILSHGNQAHALSEALERERKIRSEYSNGSDLLYSLEDLKLGASGNLSVLDPGRRIELTLGEIGVSYFSYKSVLLDAKPDSGPFDYPYAAFLVPRNRAHEWLFAVEEGQWLVSASSKAARLLMILLDSSQAIASTEDIQMDLSPLVKQLSPGDLDHEFQIPYMTAGDGIKQRKTVCEVSSALTGSIIVEDVIWAKLDEELNRRFPSPDLTFRRLIFQRTENLVQSEALLYGEAPDTVTIKSDDNEPEKNSKSRKKGKQTNLKSEVYDPLASTSIMQVVHDYLASSYHSGIISGFMLISSHLQGVVSDGGTVKAVVIGLGAGLLPMFLRKCIPSIAIEVIELDPVVLDVARDYFEFKEDERLKVHIADGIQFVREKDDSSEIDILIVDVDSEETSSGLACPASNFVEESFLLSARYALSEQGLLVINLVSRSSSVKAPIYSSLKTVFRNLFSLQLEEDVNEVIFALRTDILVDEDDFSEALNVLVKALDLEKQEWGQSIIDASKLIKRLN